MTDKELLEYAAKAAGIEMPVWVDCVTDYDSAHFGSPAMQIGGAWSANTWNPLTDDGDALRLAVTLNMSADFFDDEIAVGYTPNCNESQQVVEFTGDDPYAATRRAIVRAAAEIGKEMK
jgi:hypothetical protein